MLAGVSLVACADPASTPTTTVVSLVSTSATMSEPTTPTSAPTTTSSVVDVDPIDSSTLRGLTERRPLHEGASYRFRVGLDLVVTPPTVGWEALGYEPGVAVLFGWRGPSGVARETLDVLVFRPDDDLDRAWARFEDAMDRGFVDLGVAWEWARTGTMSIGNTEVEWREVTMPDEGNPTRVPGDPRVINLTEVGRAALWVGTTARVAVVESDGITLTFVVYETRCACEVATSWNRNSHVDAEENELHDWLPELEAFLQAIVIDP